jgi:predicted small lipoprotein YifL
MMSTMKKQLWYMVLLAAMMLLAACSNTEPLEQPTQENPRAEQSQVEEEPPIEQPTEEPVKEPAEELQEEPQEAVDEGTPPTAQEAATTVLRALKSGNMEAVAAWAHPEKGVRFSPYAYVDTEKDQVLTREELSDAMASTTARVWREFAGTGDAIELTYADYHKKFVYDANFLEDAETGLNESLGEGTTINNLNEVYPQETHDFVEFHIAGIDPTYEGMDWRSLRLVFEKNGMDRSLVGIIHDQWTP